MSNHEVDALAQKSQDVFSSERREDYWAILIAILTLILCYFFPDQVYNFFKKTLFW